VRDVSSKYRALLFEPSAPEIQRLRNQMFGQVDCAENQTDGEASICINARWLGPQSTLIMVPTQSQDTELLALSQKCQDSDSRQRRYWDFKRIASFWPWYGVDIDEKNLPQEIGIDDRAICFNKGCYLGQETVARLDALGQVQKQLALVGIQTEKGNELRVPCELFIEGKPIGVVTSIAPVTTSEGSIHDRWTGLAMLRRGYFQEGGKWLLDGGEVLEVWSKQWR
jgi:folate-binding protein YgfZ